VIPEEGQRGVAGVQLVLEKTRYDRRERAKQGAKAKGSVLHQMRAAVPERRKDRRDLLSIHTRREKKKSLRHRRMRTILLAVGKKRGINPQGEGRASRLGKSGGGSFP